MEPQVHFATSDLRKWNRVAFTKLHDDMEGLRERIKRAAGYTWDNSHFYIDDAYGHPALSINFESTGISLWSAKTGTTVDILAENEFGVTQEILNEIYAAVSQVGQGFTQCCECHKWVKSYHSYSYAGAACNRCYDPKKHLPPDTSGD